MKKLFVVTSDPTTAEQDKVFYDWFEPKFNWWHWLSQTWLLIDEAGDYSANEIRDGFRECVPGVYVVVFEIRSGGNTWSGFGPNSDTDTEKNMFTWMQDNWKL
jgi:hypothetical protein